MNKQESKELIEKLKQRIQAFEVASEDLSKLIGYPSGEFGESIGYIVDMLVETCLLYTSPSPRDRQKSRMPSSA